MIFKVNGLDYLIVEVPENDKNLLIDDAYHLGTCNYKMQIIFLMENVKEQQKQSVLIHELTHVFINAHGFLANDNFSHEQVCEFVAYHGENIICIANQYLKWKLENKVN